MGAGFIALSHRVGRVIEIRMRGSLGLAEAVDSFARSRRVVEQATGPAIVVVDVRRTEPFSDEVAQQLVANTTYFTKLGKIERMAVLLGGPGLFAVQAEAILVVSHQKMARTFLDVPSLLAFAGEAATGAERARILEFLEESERPEGELPSGGAAQIQRFLDAIVTNIPNMVFVKDAENLSFQLLNRAGEELIGLTQADLLGKTDFDFFPEADARFFQSKDLETLNSGKLVDIPVEPIQTKRGRRWLHTKKVPILSDAGMPLFLLGISEDITDFKLAQDALVRSQEETAAANRELEAFNYSVSHDLRNPLWQVDGFSKSLIEHCADKLDDESMQQLRLIRAAAQRMNRLIDNLLKLARTSRVHVRRSKVDLAELAAEVVEDLRRADPARVVEVVLPEHLWGEGDPELLRVALDNLISNAWKFTGKRSEAKIELGIVAEGTASPVYFVRDNGVGFDVASASKLFSPFQRLQNEFPGSGIGLATVQRIILRHGGRIWTESTVDGGATFFFTLMEDTQASQVP